MTAAPATPDPAPRESPPALLEYASAALSRDPWRPILFRPSRRTILLALLTAAAFTWLALRHHPWRRAAVIPADYVRHPLFTPDNRLLVLDTRHGARVYDPATGGVVRTVLPAIDAGTYRYFVMARGEQILALPHIDPLAVLYDVGSGRIVRRLPNPDPVGSMLVAVAPDVPRFVTTDHARKNNSAASPVTSDAHWWDLTGAKPMYRVPLPVGLPVEFSPDGRYLLHRHHTHSDGYALMDAATLRGGVEIALPHGVAQLQEGFAGPEHFWTMTATPANNPPGMRYRLDAYAAPTGRRMGTIDYGPRPRGTSGPIAVAVSSDATRVAALELQPAGPGVRLNQHSLVVRELAGGAVLYDQPCDVPVPARFFPDNRRLVAGHRDTPEPAVIDPRHARPLAVLPMGGVDYGGAGPVVSPDGETVAVPAGEGDRELALFRRAGWDCPESPRGALAFPHLWLTAALFTGTTLSLAADARRARPPAVSHPPPAGVVIGLMAVALPLSVYFVLSAAVSRLPPLPVAVVLLILAVGLVTHGRFWRVAALSVIAATLPVLVYAAYRVHRAGLDAAARLEVLDRYYDVPHLPVFLVMCGLAAVAGAGVFLLARRRA
jgi:hypothetical protein